MSRKKKDAAQHTRHILTCFSHQVKHVILTGGNPQSLGYRSFLQLQSFLSLSKSSSLTVGGFAGLVHNSDSLFFHGLEPLSKFSQLLLD
jgi:hypothetical protein